MNERLLHYLWQFQYFNRNDLLTVGGEQLEIIDQGKYNCNQGPDFSNAKILLDEAIWVGNIELHVRSSDWRRHAHSHDPNYTNVILHVVWVNDEPAPGISVPMLVLCDRVPKVLLSRYSLWMGSRAFIPCKAHIGQVNDMIWKRWKERLLVERLERRAEKIAAMLAETHEHWDEVLWRMIARSFGQRVNADAFEEIAKSVSLSIIRRHRQHEDVVKALLLGQAGLLGQTFRQSTIYAIDHGPHKDENELQENEYLRRHFSDRRERLSVLSAAEFLRVQRDYNFYAYKYGLKPVFSPVHFLRMRPATFPDRKLIELAEIICRLELGFSDLLSTNLPSLRRLFSAATLINAVLPMIYAYGRKRNEYKCLLKAIEAVCELRAERNVITNNFLSCGADVKTAGDSQSLIELKTMYCDHRRCLECAIGAAILKTL